MGITETLDWLVVEIVYDVINLSSFKVQEWNFVWKWVKLVIHFAKKI